MRRIKTSVLLLGFVGFVLFLYTVLLIPVLHTNYTPPYKIPEIPKTITMKPVIHNDKHINNYSNNLKKRIDFDCVRIIEGDEKEINKVKNRPTKTYSSPGISSITNCEQFRQKRGYYLYPITEEEREFPIAFSLLMYKEFGQAERLLRAIYRPHNVYCIHVDKSAEKQVHQIMKNISNCLENVFIVSKTEDIIYPGFSRLQAELNCMKDLLKSNVKWKYFINLPSEEFPLKTNSELVKILKVYNGANDIEGITEKRRMMGNRLKYKVVERGNTIVKTKELIGKPPHNIPIVKGSAYGVFSRSFVNFTLNDRKSMDLLLWMKDVLSPDEYYWATLNHDKSLKAPGGYTGVPDKKPWLAVYANWGQRATCHDAKFVRGICIFGLWDLSHLISRKELFANKFHANYQPEALDCLEEWLLNKTFNPLPLDLYHYRQLPFIIK